MLTLLAPAILRSVIELPCGLIPTRNEKTGKLILIIKIHKEYILAAQIKGGFSFYLAPLQSSSGLTAALATAFFDNEDEPLLIKTPLLFDDQFSRDILELLSYKELEVYFFDELGREWLGYLASVSDKLSLLATGTGFKLLAYHEHTVNDIHRCLNIWFANRTPKDDANAIRVVFVNELFPQDIVRLDCRPGDHDYNGSDPYSFTQLVKGNAGYFQERDIIACLKRSFRGEQLFINPFRRDNGKEFVDVLAANDGDLLFIQAKDSPNTKVSLSRTIPRKRNTSHSQIEKGINQVKGAAAYIHKQSNLELRVGDSNIDIELRSKKIIGVLVIQELFIDEGVAFVERYREMNGLVDVFALLDYAAFFSFCYVFHDEHQLLKAFADYSAKILSEGIWIAPQTYVFNFGLKD